MKNILRYPEVEERKPLPTNPEEAWKVLLAEEEPEPLPGELEAWNLASLVDIYCLFLDYFPEKVEKLVHPSLLLIALKTKAALPKF